MSAAEGYLNKKISRRGRSPAAALHILQKSVKTTCIIQIACIRKYSPISGARNAALYMVKRSRYFALSAGYSLAMALYDIRLAIEAISVPSPPMLQPAISAA